MGKCFFKNFFVEGIFLVQNNLRNSENQRYSKYSLAFNCDPVF